MTQDNAFTVSPSQLFEVGVANALAGIGMLISGPPSSSKSAIVNKIHAHLDATLPDGCDIINVHAGTMEPVDVGGLPVVSEDGSVDKLPIGVLRRILDAKKPTICFFDELGHATHAVQGALFQLFWGHTLENHKVPDCVTFICATNRREDRAGVQGILAPLKDRLVHYEVSPSYSDWRTWAATAGINTQLLAFHEWKRGEAFYEWKATSNLEKHATARGWEMVSNIMATGLTGELRIASFVGCVGAGRAIEFDGFLALADRMPSLDSILDDPDAVEMLEASDAGVMFALSAALCQAIVDGDARFKNAWRWAERMAEASHVEMAAFMVKTISDSDKATGKNHCVGEAFMRLVTKHIADVLHN